MVKPRVKYLSPEDIKQELRQFEAKHRMSSADFYEKYNRGEMGDSAEVMRWSALYEMSAKAARRRVKA